MWMGSLSVSSSCDGMLGVSTSCGAGTDGWSIGMGTGGDLPSKS
jgi:hypothetical protein